LEDSGRHGKMRFKKVEMVPDWFKVVKSGLLRRKICGVSCRKSNLVNLQDYRRLSCLLFDFRVNVMYEPSVPRQNSEDLMLNK
jgi:hypothetical protein